MGCSPSALHAYEISMARALPTPRQSQYRPMSKKASQTSASSFSQPVTLTEHQKKRVRDSWYKLRAQLTTLGISVFKEIFRLDPRAKALFSFKEKANEELENDPRFRGHAARFMQAIGAVVDRLDNTDNELQSTLVDLGGQHRQFHSFSKEYFSLFTKAFLIVLESHIGREKFNADLKNAWIMVIKFMVNEMQTGYGDLGQGPTPVKTDPLEAVRELEEKESEAYMATLENMKIMTM